jgi:hypothetical protein
MTRILLNIIYFQRFTCTDSQPGETKRSRESMSGQAAGNFRIGICNIGKIELVARTIQEQDGNPLSRQGVAAFFNYERQQLVQLNACRKGASEVIEQTQSRRISFTGHAG